MLLLPEGGGAVVVVGVHLVVVDVEAGQQGGAGRTAHGRGHVCVREVGTAVTKDAKGLGHEVHGTWNAVKNSMNKIKIKLYLCFYLGLFL